MRAAAAQLLCERGAQVFRRKRGALPDFGVLSFANSREARFVTIANTSSGALLANYVESSWGLASPEVLLSVTGTAQEFTLAPRLQAALEQGRREVRERAALPPAPAGSARRCTAGKMEPVAAVI